MKMAVLWYPVFWDMDPIAIGFPKSMRFWFEKIASKQSGFHLFLTPDILPFKCRKVLFLSQNKEFFLTRIFMFSKNIVIQTIDF